MSQPTINLKAQYEAILQAQHDSAERVRLIHFLESNLLITVGNNINEHREKANLTTRELAQLSQTNYSIIEKIEAGDLRKLEAILLFRIVSILGISRDELLEGIID